MQSSQRGEIVVHDECHRGALPHIASHDPARALRDIALNRGIVERCRQAISDQGIAMASRG